MEYNEIAAKWWADKLRNVGPGNFNNGDQSSEGGIAMMLATMLAIETSPNSDAIDLFEQKLAEEIKERNSFGGTLILDVDYGPDMILGNIAKETGVSTTGFPWKTTMWITDEEVAVCCGAGSQRQIIFPEQVVTDKISSCDDGICNNCSSFKLLPDPDPTDRFRDHDKKAVCNELNLVIEGKLERPSEWENVKKPLYCPKLGRSLSEEEKKMAETQLNLIKTLPQNNK